MKPEETVETYLRTQAEKLGFLCYKFVSPANDGVPDRILVGHGKTFFVETKAHGGKPRKLQAKVIARINEHGGLAFVAASKEAVDTLLNTMMQDAAVSNKKKRQKNSIVNSCVSERDET